MNIDFVENDKHLSAYSMRYVSIIIFKTANKSPEYIYNETGVVLPEKIKTLPINKRPTKDNV